METVLEVIQAGIGSTIQARALRGFRDLGLSTAGPLDEWSLQRANLLVGNQKFQPCIELALGPLSLLARSDCLVAVVGYGFKVEVNNQEQPVNHSLLLNANDILSITHTKKSGVAYIAVQGGLRNESCSQQGFCLEKQDMLSAENATGRSELPLRRGVRLETVNHNILAITGPEHSLIPLEVVDHFWQSNWKIAPSRNRMGVRLTSVNQLDFDIRLPSLMSHAVLPGTVQLTKPDSCIALAQDCQTTGGYPRIATIISAETWKLAQLPTGEEIRFIPCDIERARKELHRKNCEINRLEIATQLNTLL